MKTAAIGITNPSALAEGDQSRPVRKFAELSLSEQKSSAEKMVASVRKISNAHRLVMLQKLSKSELSVGALQEVLGRGQPSISNDLVLMRNLGLVQSDRQGNYCLSRLAKNKQKSVECLLEILLEAE